MPTTILDGETYESALRRRMEEEAEYIKKMLEEDGPGEEDGPWAEGWDERTGGVK